MRFDFDSMCVALGFLGFLTFCGVSIRGCQDHENTTQKHRPAIFAACRNACGDEGVRELTEGRCVCD